MATAQETINTGLEALKVLGFGQQPTTSESVYCLKHLNAFIAELAGVGGSLPFVTQTVTSSFDVTTQWPALRLMCMDGATITLPLASSSYNPPADGMRIHVIDASETADTSNITIARNGWLINGTAANYTISTEGGSVMLMFQANSGNWVVVTSLGLSDDLPFPAEFDIPVALNAALRYTLFGQSLSPADQRRADEGMSRFRARYAKPPPAQFDAAISGIGGGGRITRTLNDFLNGIDT